ncbi:hypothetical protein LAV77_18915 [Priestia megaterium]|uniref:hypothetical protein n=1 Tax=Priestia megaterium TaxID=1404 RepID=UPI002B24A31A|nr:hypothetical protein [Priestia megaterium]MEB2266881.1 hypothetical protein [Priestia megaterium]
MKNIFMKSFMKSMTVLTLLIVALCEVNQVKTEAASKPTNQDLILLTSTTTSLPIFTMAILKCLIQ